MKHISARPIAWTIKNLKSNLPLKTRIEFFIPQFPEKYFQTQPFPIWAIAQSEISPVNAIFRQKVNWHYPLRVPSEHSLTVKLYLPLEELPPNPFVTLFYEYEKSSKYVSKFPTWLD